MNHASLPEDLQSCHAMIKQLREQLGECQRRLGLHVGHERAEMERRHGKGVANGGLLELGRAMGGQLTDAQREVIEAELAAEDAMRLRRPGRGRKK